MEKIRLRKYKKGDEINLVSLYEYFFPEKMSLKLWEWKFKKNPNGNLIVVAFNKKKEIVGQYYLQFKKGVYNGGEKLFILSVDTYIRVECRGQGFVNGAYKFLKKKEFFLYGFPNSFGVRSHIKAHGSEFGREEKIIILGKKNLLLFPHFSFKFKKSNHLNIVPLNKNNFYEFDNLWKSKVRELNTSVIRDCEYIKWRLLECPNKNNIFFIKYRNNTIGYFSVYLKNGICYISDILIFNKYMNKKLVSVINAFCRNEFKFNRMKLLINDNIIVKAFLLNGYFVEDKITIRYGKNDKSQEHLNFYLTLSDTDFF
ncbi:hypothetical protein J4205_00485 [Candidatus Pacearchaeota archaeon]|nr:hypothetical protein [Candidatus Pacearchaeota archaeon]